MELQIKTKTKSCAGYYYIETFGCQMNEFDSERLSFILENLNYLKTGRAEDADLIVINTCAVRKKAENRLFGHIGNLKALKLINPDLIICIGGCAAASLREKIIEKFPFVDIVFGTKNLDALPDLINRKKRLSDGICSIENSGDIPHDFYSFKRRFGFKAFLPVMVGCNNHCSYCIVPHVRGSEVSVKPEKIIEAAKMLSNSGTVEITLLGQNVNSYGNDFNESEKITFAQLLDKISAIEGLKRIRFMTSHPKDFSDELIEIIGKHKNLAKHIHLPLQAGSDRILGLMNRKYSRKDYINLYRKIKTVLPGCSVTTDLIVGFPGETEDDFNRTLDLVGQLRFHRAFTFLYSQRKGTAAEKLPDSTKPGEKKAWFSRLTELQNGISLEENKKSVGKIFEVLVEGSAGKNNGLLEGRLENNTVVNFEGRRELAGKFINVEITDARSFYLEGKIAGDNR